MNNEKKIKHGDYLAVITEESKISVSFKVYAIFNCEDKTILFTNNIGNIIESIDNAFYSLHGTCKNRGCLETRIYFNDDEYWGEELKSISEIVEKIMRHFKNFWNIK